jgi:hypothetical protein
MEDYLKYQKCNISVTTGRIFPKFQTLGYMTKENFANVSNEDDLKWKTTSNIKFEISQQLLVGSSPNFNPCKEDDLQNRKLIH